ncbi:hypothetical protein, partial [Arachnia propionica]|uniref:hypothetical protein n=1 Tax=Arachnia propionica TaxID=1750 RepID=UPI001C897C9F
GLGFGGEVAQDHDVGGVGHLVEDDGLLDLLVLVLRGEVVVVVGVGVGGGLLVEVVSRRVVLA